MSALLVTGGVFAYYLFLYTAYCKTKKTLDFALLTEVLTVSKGVDHTLVQMNKVISLVGITILALAFLPMFSSMRYDLLIHASYLLWTHTAYSTYKYWDSPNIPVFPLSGWSIGATLSDLKAEPKRWVAGMRKVSFWCGFFGQLIILAWNFGLVGTTVGVCVGLMLLSHTHFYTMEVDFKGVLQVRPAAFLPFLLCGGVVLISLLSLMR
eukprot:comp28285_c0_seq1/m.47193 comp28285_c0_seq1/g.47193  ORF comp28285_c0_seq1/g.47193 comp28285_c0_seq1/m.47193 type:complete len:209 (-) comp28285_c0_seq1:279-905(-)